ncbi:unnamed protein product [Effrenium voratum]|uniref:FAD-dependent oxidoreductase domain-containing protein 1 n=1 Tax=Effrenium voratum TaxID=2562239 RepID=A0AA36JS37_9DINO|nr:unnamed protein product [Effrenium voratum]CAJ1416650.1 unnamed protein product [Effrenium voratum]
MLRRLSRLPSLQLARRFSAARCEVAIVGGGVIGASTALHLAASLGDGSKITVFEPDACYARASAPRSAGGIRQQFSLPVNVELSLYGIHFLKQRLRELCEGVDVDTDVQFKEHGYLLLSTPDGEAALRANNAVQHAAGADWVQLLDASELNTRFPWLSTEGLALGSFGTRNEGYFDPWALLQAMRKGAMAKGVRFVDQKVTGLRRPGSSIEAIQLADGTDVAVSTVVNAAGAFGGEVVAMCGDVTPLPVAPRKRCIFMFHVGQEVTSDGVPRPPDNTPLTIDASGVWFRSEGSRGRFLCGVSPKPEDDADCDADALDVIDHDLFEDIIWPALAERAPALEAIKLESSWAGLYEYNTLDQNGVVGWHPDVSNLLVATGFSGHGLQQAPGVGRAVAELLTSGGYQTLDLSILGYDRILRNEPVFERGIY